MATDPKSPGHGQTRVLIAGGGVAALEALLALRDLAQERVCVELLSPRTDFSYRPLAVGEPFGLGEARRYDLERIAREHGASLRVGSLSEVEPERSRVHMELGESLEYDLLVVAVGAKTRPSLEGAITVGGPGYTARFRTVLRELEERKVRRLTFAVPAGASWPLPLYELALMTATRVAERGLRQVELRLVTPEKAPLELFGAEASAGVAALLRERGIDLRTGLYPSQLEEGTLAVVPGERGPVPAERVVTLPTLAGPDLAGLPRDPEGFIPVDLHGLVQGQADVYAAGDATTFPIKQGGIATQQADAVAEAVAARANAPITPRPFRPVLRGLLLTGGSPRYMRADVAGGGGARWPIAEHALWWPPSKIAGHYLSPYLALHHEELELGGRPPGDIAVDLELRLEQSAAGDSRRRAIITPGGSQHVIAIPRRGE